MTLLQDMKSRPFTQALADYIRKTEPGEHTRERVAVIHYLALPLSDRFEVLMELARHV